MEVRWARRTVKDIDHIFKLIERDNLKSARSVIQTIYDGCVSLADFPQRGRPGRMQGGREYAITRNMSRNYCFCKTFCRTLPGHL
jgi:toxin ParE1/3/4